MDDGDNWPRHGLYMTGSSNDECEGRQQVDRRVGCCNSFLPFYHSVSPHNNILLVLKGLRNMEIFSVSRLSPSPSILPLCVRAYAQHNCSISSGFSLCYPFKKKKKDTQNRIWATIVQERHCVDSRHFSCKLLKSSRRNLQCNRRRVGNSLCYENKKRVRASRNEVSGFNFRICCSTNACGIVCHLHFTSYSHFSHATMLPVPSVIQMEHFQPTQGNLTIYSTDS